MLPKVFILLWKDFLIRKNHPIVTALEILVPVALIVLENAFMPRVPRDPIDNDPMSFEVFEGSCKKHGHYEKIAYEPSHRFTDLIMSKASCYAGYHVSHVKPGLLNSSLFDIGVEFEVHDVSHALEYVIYPTMPFWVKISTLWRNGGPALPKYSAVPMQTILELQRAIDTAYMDLKSVPAKKINMQNTDMHPRGVFIMTQLIYIAVFVQLIFIIPPIVSRIVQEKYTGAKELMVMMGVSKLEIWAAKFLDAYIIQLISVSGVVTFFYVPLQNNSNVLEKNAMELWAIMMFGFIGFIIFLFFFTCFFQKSTMAVFTIGSFCVITFLVDNYIFLHPDIPGYSLYITCIFPHTALINAVFIWLTFQGFGKELSLYENVLDKKGAPVLYEIFIIMVADIIVYAFLTWYFENVIPGKFGVPKPLSFPFKKTYWVRNKPHAVSTNQNVNEIPSSFEPVPANLQSAVSINNVSKIYKSVIKGNVVAVDNITLNFYEGEISALLGHNGAGKTTIFSMITGLTYPTSGKLIINGYDIETNIDKARRSLGLCPQQDMLINDLTPIQTLKFFGMIKGLTFQEAKKETFELIKKFKLSSSETTASHKLSGGQKRKLSLAIALIGGSKVLILDEPTSGMDPEIRREIWELLLNFRGKRTILLTTHFMEEADALCDRIAIMDHGVVKCYGSSMFLKSKYGKGYVLNVVLQDVERSGEIIDFVKGIVPSAQLKAQNIRTLSFELAENNASSFPALLSELENKQKTDEIISYSVNVASLEEVFLSLKSGQNDFDAVDSPHYTNLDFREEPNLLRSRSFSLLWQQFLALIIKKWIVYRKSYLSLLAFCILPTIIIVLTRFLSSQSKYAQVPVDISNGQRLTYSLDLYKNSIVLYSTDDESISETFEKYILGLGAIPLKTDSITATLYKTFIEDFNEYSNRMNLGIEFLKDEVKVYHNEDAVHMVPIAFNVLHNFWLKNAGENVTIQVSIDPSFVNKHAYVATPKLSSKCNIGDILDYGGAQTFFYLIGVVKENFHGAKELQLMIVSTTLYWITHLVWDVLSFFIFIIIIYLMMAFSQSDDLMFNNSVEVVCGYLLWGIGLILLGYVISSFLKNLAAAFSVNVLLYIIFTFVVYFFISLDVIPEGYQYLHPSCIIKLGFDNLCTKKTSNFILALCIYDLILFCFLILRDSKILTFVFHRFMGELLKANYYTEEDLKEELVQKEEEKIKQIKNKEIEADSVLIADQLKRWYFKKAKVVPAVKGVSFTVNRGECFGLLGVNGAGKTSTFKMLTGEISTSHGKIYVCNEKVNSFKRQKCLSSIGYCPQFGGLLPIFDGREMLSFFARLRGVHSSNLEEQVDKWLAKLGLSEIAKKRCKTYSGGNQRKLTTGISLIGDCPLIFLDEPTTGVDPLSRRSIWNLIAEIQRNGQSVVLTSHSMDECEALCSRVAIMVKGKFRCIGETTILKDKFGKGYSIRLKVEPESLPKQIESLKKSVALAFPGCELIDEHLTILQYSVTTAGITAAGVFEALMKLKEDFTILESYSASAATLEQIFINFAREKS